MKKCKSISLGLELGHVPRQGKEMGFQLPSKSLDKKANIISHDGNSHIKTIGRTGSGKNVSSVTPILFDFEGSVIVLDVKGELAAITARKRSMMSKMIVLAPVDGGSDSFNPLDVAKLIGDVEMAAQFLASLIIMHPGDGKDAYWAVSAESVVVAVIVIVMLDLDPERRNLRAVCEILFADDVVYTLASILDLRGKEIPPGTYQTIASLLQTADQTRSGIISTAQAYLRIFNSGKVMAATDKSSFSLPDFAAGGEAMTIYLQIPVSFLESFAPLIKLWTGALLHGITSRKKAPEVPTLLILDEAASLGRFSFLNTLICFCRGMGLITHTLWQDLSQIRTLYPNWETLLNNSTLQFFQTGSHLAAKAVSEVTGVPVKDIQAMRGDEQLLVFEGGETRIARKLNYLTDQRYAGQWDENPLISSSKGKEAQKKTRDN